MTVAELIEKLHTFPLNLLVVSEGYETGYEPIKKIELLHVLEQQERQWWDGQFEKSDASSAIEVVFLNAESKAERK